MKIASLKAGFALVIGMCRIGVETSLTSKWLAQIAVFIRDNTSDVREQSAVFCINFAKKCPKESSEMWALNILIPYLLKGVNDPMFTVREKTHLAINHLLQLFESKSVFNAFCANGDPAVVKALTSFAVKYAP